MMSNTVRNLAVEDSATVVMRFAGGLHGVVDVRWNSRIPRDQFRVIGTEGEINLDPLSGPELRLSTRAGTMVEMLPAHDNFHYPLIENFVDAALANDPSRLACTAAQAAWTDWVIEQVVRTNST
jgi:1,5-anhydro-D-fructose reductase (1,5-anhydro-D-mannitol-forming)